MCKQIKMFILSDVKRITEVFTRVQRLSDGRVQSVYQEGLVPGNLWHQLPDIVNVHGHRLPQLGL